MNLRIAQSSLAYKDEYLWRSINYFLGKYWEGVSDFSDLLSRFDKLIEGFKDPPLEYMWFYGVVEFHGSKSAVLPPPGKLWIAKCLWQGLHSRSQFCGVVKKVAVVAPVIYLLYHLERNFSATDPSLREEIEMFVEEIVSYMSVCCSQYLTEGKQESDSLLMHIFDLARLWAMDRNHDADVFVSFFPTLHHEFQQEVMLCLGNLAGVVLKETFLLRLYLKISPRINVEDFHRDAVNVAVQTIKGFQYFYFLGESLFHFAAEPILLRQA